MSSCSQYLLQCSVTDHLHVSSSYLQQIVFHSKKWSLTVLMYFFYHVWCHKPCVTPWDPYKMLPVMLEVMPKKQKKVMMWQETVELLAMHHRDWGLKVWLLKINESSVRIIALRKKKREKKKFVKLLLTLISQQVQKHCTFWEILFKKKNIENVAFM